MSTIFLTSEDFSVEQVNASRLLFTNIRGISVVMFYSTKCVHCQTLIPIFKTLPRMIPNCQFGMVNIDLQKSVIAMSRETIDPIKFVPYIVFYANRRPIIKYSGPHNLNEIARFVTEVSRTLSSQQFFTQEAEQKSAGAQKQERAIPEYTTGFPCSTEHHKNDETHISQDDICYVTDLDAYTKK
jgi:thioredoxin-like negative regulator of GroEL